MEDKEILKEWSDKFYRYQRRMYLGASILALAVFFIFINSMGWVRDTAFIQGAFFGGSLVYFGIRYDDYIKVKSNLDTYCSHKFGKKYKDSLTEVVGIIYGKN